MNRRAQRSAFHRRTLAALLAAVVAFAAGCATHRDDYGGSNDIGFSPMYGAYNAAFDGSWDWSPGYYPAGMVIIVAPE